MKRGISVSDDDKSVFDYAMGDDVALSQSGECGKVIGRAEYDDGGPRYLVRYVAADGRQVEDWFVSSAIAHRY
jgi:hypothetical protein